MTDGTGQQVGFGGQGPATANSGQPGMWEHRASVLGPEPRGLGDKTGSHRTLGMYLGLNAYSLCYSQKTHSDPRLHYLCCTYFLSPGIRFFVGFTSYVPIPGSALNFQEGPLCPKHSRDRVSPSPLVLRRPSWIPRPPCLRGCLPPAGHQPDPRHPGAPPCPGRRPPASSSFSHMISSGGARARMASWRQCGDEVCETWCV